MFIPYTPLPIHVFSRRERSSNSYHQVFFGSLDSTF